LEGKKGDQGGKRYFQEGSLREDQRSLKRKAREMDLNQVGEERERTIREDYYPGWGRGANPAARNRGLETKPEMDSREEGGIFAGGDLQELIIKEGGEKKDL